MIKKADILKALLTSQKIRETNKEDTIKNGSVVLGKLRFFPMRMLKGRKTLAQCMKYLRLMNANLLKCWISDHVTLE